MSSPRAEALRLFRSGDLATPPPMPDIEPGSSEALDYIDSLKPQHFSALASTIELIFGHVFRKQSRRQPDGLIKKSPFRHNSWVKLEYQLGNTFAEAIKAVKPTEAYQSAQGFSELIGQLNAKRRLSAKQQLKAGVATHVGSSIVLLRSLPQIVRHHDPDCPTEEFGAIVRHPGSRVVLGRMAKTCVSKMVAIQDAVTGDQDHKSLVELSGRTLLPAQFRLREHDDGGRSLDYADFGGLSLPAGYQSYLNREPLQEETLVSSIDCRRPAVVGCPITLIAGLLSESVDWQTSIVENRQLWLPPGRREMV